MSTTTMALVVGVVFLLAGVSGFFAAPPPPDAPPLRLEHGHGLALGLLPINTLHNLVHFLFGALGMAAANGTLMGARQYFQIVAIWYATLVVLGLLPATQTLFGLVPLWGNDVWFHLALAAVAGYFGFVGAVDIPRRRA